MKKSRAILGVAYLLTGGCSQPVASDATRPHIASTTVHAPDGSIPSQLMIGVRHTVDVLVNPGTDPSKNAISSSVEINPALNVPASLKIDNREGATFAPITSVTHRRFALTCTQPGNFPLGFQLRDDAIYYGGLGYNPDPGIHVVCAAARTGLYGRVTRRGRKSSGVYFADTPIANATVAVSGFPTATTGSDGRWSVPSATGGPLRVTISAIGYSQTIAVNVTVPARSGLQLDTPLEEPFTAVRNAGAYYTTYIDYSRGRSILHTVTVITYLGSVIRTEPSLIYDWFATNLLEEGWTKKHCLERKIQEVPLFDTLMNIADSYDSLVLMNGSWWDLCNGKSLGYFYSTLGYVPSEVCSEYAPICNPNNYYKKEGGGDIIPYGTQAMLTITGLSTNQQFNIVNANENFFETPSTQWNQVGSPTHPIWDVSPRDGVSDINYAIQISNPPLLANGNIVARHVDAVPNNPDTGYTSYTSFLAYENSFARTAVGSGPNGVLFMVVADGEGVQGGAGATPNQLGHFFHDVLAASAAMAIDSGLSTELVLKGATGQRHVNTTTGEDATIQTNPYTETLKHKPGGIGAVANYIMVNPR